LGQTELGCPGNDLVDVTDGNGEGISLHVDIDPEPADVRKCVVDNYFLKMFSYIRKSAKAYIFLPGMLGGKGRICFICRHGHTLFRFWSGTVDVT